MNTRSSDSDSAPNSQTLPNPSSLGFIEAMFADFQTDPESVPEEWREYFGEVEGNGHANGVTGANGHSNGHAPSHSTGAANGTATNGAVTNGAAANGAATNGAQNGAVIGAPNGAANGASNGHARPGEGPKFKAYSIFNPPSAPAAPSTSGSASTQISARLQAQMEDASASRMEAKALQERVSRLVRAHRVRGHLVAHLDPLDLPRPYPEELDPEYYGFSPKDMEREFSYEIRHSDIYQPEGTGLTHTATLHEIVEHLRVTYCRSIGAQFMHIDDLEIREWLQERMETTRNRVELDRKQQIRILSRLTDAIAFEEFIRRKFVGAKSFSLEGAESLIPLLDLAIEEASEGGVEEIVMGMAHRGRLNVLANIIGKSPREIFREFEDKDADLHLYGGDVKYHLGYVNDFETSSGRRVHLALCFNPSHLEFVNPVAQGRCRAKQDRMGDFERKRGLTILIHGDAAFAGEGVVQETLNMSQLKGYRTGGTLHIIVNNQIGFTTGPQESRSSTYCTDVAKMLQIPIFHVNGEDPEAVAQVVKLSMEFRRAFGRDVVIDMYCYRRLGHNETDEPSFTQPRLYRAIQARKSVREAYLERLLAMKGVTAEEADAIAEQRRQQLEAELSHARAQDYQPPDHTRKTSLGVFGGPERDAADVETGVHKEKLQQMLLAQTVVPEGFTLHKQLNRFIEARRTMANGEAPLNWSAAEALALASLSVEGVPIRLTGQDTERGTFSHRHAVWHDTETDETYTPLHHLPAHLGQQARLEIVNSPLSEIGPLGLEYGYSLDTLDGLVVWEAQFGDFWNCAQVIVDQFISSAEDKWQHLSGLVMLLPHGMEGMGPEHSSARIERFLMLAAEDNIQITYPTTPAQYFHLMRRQVLRKWRKPLVVMSPKSLLRHLECVSTLDELATGQFQRVIPEVRDIDPTKVSRVLLCTGKIFYELDKKREDLGRDDVAIVRVEQLYPFPEKELKAALSTYPETVPVVWVQEEPMNMGAWRFMRITLGQKAFGKHAFRGVCRPGSASPATGSSSAHKKEQDLVLQEAFDILKKKK